MSGGHSLFNGDYLTIGNQWATVTITYDPTDYDKDKPYVASGDLKHAHLSSTPFANLNAAIQYAYESLAYFAKGRAA